VSCFSHYSTAISAAWGPFGVAWGGRPASFRCLPRVLRRTPARLESGCRARIGRNPSGVHGHRSGQPGRSSSWRSDSGTGRQPRRPNGFEHDDIGSGPRLFAGSNSADSKVLGTSPTICSRRTNRVSKKRLNAYANLDAGSEPMDEADDDFFSPKRVPGRSPDSGHPSGGAPSDRPREGLIESLGLNVSSLNAARTSRIGQSCYKLFVGLGLIAVAFSKRPIPPKQEPSSICSEWPPSSIVLPPRVVPSPVLSGPIMGVPEGIPPSLSSSSGPFRGGRQVSPCFSPAR